MRQVIGRAKEWLENVFSVGGGGVGATPEIARANAYAPKSRRFGPYGEAYVVSVKQPWASLLLAGVKRFEVREGWAPREPGLFFVHASSGKASRWRELREDTFIQQGLRLAGLTDERGWPRSAILGLVEVKHIFAPGDERPNDTTKLDEALAGTLDDVFLWEIGQRWAFPEPVACPGKLNLWPVPAELRHAVNTQLEKAEAPIRL